MACDRVVQGKAVVFFPCFADGVMDTRTLHAAEPAGDTKWVSQIWIRQANFEGTTGRPDSDSEEEEDEDESDDEPADQENDNDTQTSRPPTEQ